MFCGIILHQLKQEVGRTVDDDYNPTESPLDLAETTPKNSISRNFTPYFEGGNWLRRPKNFHFAIFGWLVISFSDREK